MTLPGLHPPFATMKILFLLLTATIADAASKPKLKSRPLAVPISVVWGCMFPCNAEDDSRQIGTVRFATCDQQAYTEENIAHATSLCRSKYKTDQVKASFAGHDHVTLALCETSGNTCSGRGPIPVNFICTVHCPNIRHAKLFSVCAGDETAAWSQANRICENPATPPRDLIAPKDVCIPLGQVGCQL